MSILDNNTVKNIIYDLYPSSSIGGNTTTNTKKEITELIINNFELINKYYKLEDITNILIHIDSIESKNYNITTRNNTIINELMKIKTIDAIISNDKNKLDDDKFVIYILYEKGDAHAISIFFKKVDTHYRIYIKNTGGGCNYHTIYKDDIGTVNGILCFYVNNTIANNFYKLITTITCIPINMFYCVVLKYFFTDKEQLKQKDLLIDKYSIIGTKHKIQGIGNCTSIAFLSIFEYFEIEEILNKKELKIYEIIDTPQYTKMYNELKINLLTDYIIKIIDIPYINKYLKTELVMLHNISNESDYKKKICTKLQNNTIKEHLIITSDKSQKFYIIEKEEIKTKNIDKTKYNILFDLFKELEIIMTTYTFDNILKFYIKCGSICKYISDYMKEDILSAFMFHTKLSYSILNYNNKLLKEKYNDATCIVDIYITIHSTIQLFMKNDINICQYVRPIYASGVFIDGNNFNLVVMYSILFVILKIHAICNKPVETQQINKIDKIIFINLLFSDITINCRYEYDIITELKKYILEDNNYIFDYLLAPHTITENDYEIKISQPDGMLYKKTTITIMTNNILNSRINNFIIQKSGITKCSDYYYKLLLNVENSYIIEVFTSRQPTISENHNINVEYYIFDIFFIAFINKLDYIDDKISYNLIDTAIDSRNILFDMLNCVETYNISNRHIKQSGCEYNKLFQLKYGTTGIQTDTSNKITSFEYYCFNNSLQHIIDINHIEFNNIVNKILDTMLLRLENGEVLYVKLIYYKIIFTIIQLCELISIDVNTIRDKIIKINKYMNNNIFLSYICDSDKTPFDELSFFLYKSLLFMCITDNVYITNIIGICKYIYYNDINFINKITTISDISNRTKYNVIIENKSDAFVNKWCTYVDATKDNIIYPNLEGMYTEITSDNNIVSWKILYNNILSVSLCDKHIFNGVAYKKYITDNTICTNKCYFDNDDIFNYSTDEEIDVDTREKDIIKFNIITDVNTYQCIGTKYNILKSHITYYRISKIMDETSHIIYETIKKKKYINNIYLQLQYDFEYNTIEHLELIQNIDTNYYGITKYATYYVYLTNKTYNLKARLKLNSKYKEEYNILKLYDIITHTNKQFVNIYIKLLSMCNNGSINNSEMQYNDIIVVDINNNTKYMICENLNCIFEYTFDDTSKISKLYFDGMIMCVSPTDNHFINKYLQHTEGCVFYDESKLIYYYCGTNDLNNKLYYVQISECDIYNNSSNSMLYFLRDMLIGQCYEIAYNICLAIVDTSYFDINVINKYMKRIDSPTEYNKSLYLQYFIYLFETISNSDKYINKLSILQTKYLIEHGFSFKIFVLNIIQQYTVNFGYDTILEKIKNIKLDNKQVTENIIDSMIIMCLFNDIKIENKYFSYISNAWNSYYSTHLDKNSEFIIEYNTDIIKAINNTHVVKYAELNTSNVIYNELKYTERTEKITIPKQYTIIKDTIHKDYNSFVEYINTKKNISIEELNTIRSKCDKIFKDGLMYINKLYENNIFFDMRYELLKSDDTTFILHYDIFMNMNLSRILYRQITDTLENNNNTDKFINLTNENIFMNITNNGKKKERILMLFEIIFGSAINDKQYKLIYDIINELKENRSHFHQLLMGEGKSAVISPCITLLLLEKCESDNKYVYNITLDTLLKQTTNNILPYINSIHKHNKYVKIYSDSQFKEIVLNKKMKNENCDYTNCYFIYDEIDEINDPLKSQLNIIDCIHNTNNEIIYEIIYDFISYFYTDKHNLKKEYYNDEPHFILIDSKINDVKNDLLKNDLLKIFIEICKNNKIGAKELTCLEQLIINSSSNSCNEIVQSSSNDLLVNNLYEFFIMVPTIFKQIHRLHFGLDINIDNVVDRKRLFTAIPYKACETPTIDSEFSNILYVCALTVICFHDRKINRIRNIDIIEICNYLSHQIKIRNIKDNTNFYIVLYKLLVGQYNILLEDINKYKFSDAQLLNISNIFYNSDISKNANYKIIKYYIVKILLPKYIRLVDSYNNIGITDILSSKISTHRTGFTGTPEIIIPFDIDDKYNIGDIRLQNHGDGAIAYSFLNNSKILVIDTIQDIYSELNSYNALIDVGAYFINNKNIDVAKQIIQNNDKFNYVVYIDENNNKIGIDKHFVSYNYNDIRENLSNVFFYYDQGHITGQDLKIYNKAIGLITISNFTRFRDASQGIFRLRQINKGQTINFCVRKSYISEISNEQIEPIEPIDILNFCINNENKYKESQKKQYSKQNILTLYRDEIINTDSVKDIIYGNKVLHYLKNCDGSISLYRQPARIIFIDRDKIKHNTHIDDLVLIEYNSFKQLLKSRHYKNLINSYTIIENIKTYNASIVINREIHKNIQEDIQKTININFTCKLKKYDEAIRSKFINILDYFVEKDFKSDVTSKIFVELMKYNGIQIYVSILFQNSYIPTIEQYDGYLLNDNGIILLTSYEMIRIRDYVMNNLKDLKDFIYSFRLCYINNDIYYENKTINEKYNNITNIMYLIFNNHALTNKELFLLLGDKIEINQVLFTCFVYNYNVLFNFIYLDFTKFKRYDLVMFVLISHKLYNMNINTLDKLTYLDYFKEDTKCNKIIREYISKPIFKDFVEYFLNIYSYNNYTQFLSNYNIDELWSIIKVNIVHELNECV